ncbi:CTNA2 protein, partial [Vireo altiloquus]|nr:CTNA2 protein [Vireo altiloquus]
SQLRKAVMDHISDSFLETNVPLLVLIEAAKSGNEKEVKEYAQVFREHANKLVEVSDLTDTARFPSGTSRRGKKSCTLDEKDFAPPIPALQSLLGEERLLLNTEAKKLLGASISSHLLVPVLLIRGDALSVTFLLWLMYLYKPFLLFFASPAKFSSIHFGQLNKVGSIQLCKLCFFRDQLMELAQSFWEWVFWKSCMSWENMLFHSNPSHRDAALCRVWRRDLISRSHSDISPSLYLIQIAFSLRRFRPPKAVQGQVNVDLKIFEWDLQAYITEQGFQQRYFAALSYFTVANGYFTEVIYMGFCSPAQKMYYSSCIKSFHSRQSSIRIKEGIKWFTCLELHSHPDDFPISLQVANLACSISNNEEGVKLVRMAATQIDSLCPQVINAALTLAARPQSKVAQDNMDVFKDQWEKQVRVLTEAVDDITSVDDFLSVSENHILEDVNKCVIALQEGDVDTLDRTAGAIRGRAARVIHIINAEMENYETGVYTEKVLEATKLLSETVMPRFAEQVEVAIEALSANVPQPFEENEFIDASRLVYDGVRDIRKAVLMIRTPEELEDDSDFEQEDYDVRSRTSVQTEDDQLIAGQSARAIMAQLPQEEKAKIAEQVEIFHQEKSKLDAEVAKWDDSGNDIIVLAKQMCMIMMEMTDFTRGKGPLKNTSDVINAAKKIAEAGSRMDKLARAVADQCPDSACKQDLLAYLQRIALYCHQLNICSKVKAEVQNLGGELIVSGLDSATSLIQAAKNLMNAVVLTVKASYVASTKYQKVYGTAAVNSPVVSWKMKAPEKKPLVKREKPEEYQTRVRRGSQKKHISPVQALSEFKAMDSF